jgi:hypothetical protein
MLPAFEANVFATLIHHAGRTSTATDDGANRGPFAATGYGADDRAHT